MAITFRFFSRRLLIPALAGALTMAPAFLLSEAPASAAPLPAGAVSTGVGLPAKAPALSAQTVGGLSGAAVPAMLQSEPIAADPLMLLARVNAPFPLRYAFGIVLVVWLALVPWPSLRH